LKRLDADVVHAAYDGAIPPRLMVSSGDSVVVRTLDARRGAFSEIEPGTSFELPPPSAGSSNPLTGPIAVAGARGGDALAVDVLAIEPLGPAWVGAHAHVNPLEPGRVDRSFGRIASVADGDVLYSDGVAFPARPMVGCLGTAPDEPVGAGGAGPNGGNLDHTIVRPGARVLLPVSIDDARLFVGDVHAAQGDGELSGVALETAADVTLRLSVVPDLALSWPWVETRARIAVLTCAWDFADARRHAVSAAMALLEARLAMTAGDALAFISAAGDLRIGQAYGGAEMTLRLELPRCPGLELTDLPTFQES
jgi:amidase